MKIKHNAGFTIIELMIVVALIGIIATIAYPSYQEGIKKSRRADAKGALAGFANAMERRFTVSNNYCDSGGLGGTAVSNCGGSMQDTGSPTIYATSSPVDSRTEVYYELTINDVTVKPAGYTLYAKPVNAQATDKCGTLTLTNTGQRDIKDAQSGTTKEECW